MSTNQIIVKMVLDRWNKVNNAFTDVIDSIFEDRLMDAIAPGKNRGIYVLGHIVAVSDDTLPVLDFGDKLYPELFDIFVKSPDKAVTQIPSAAQLRTSWQSVNARMTKKMNSLSVEDWFQQHNSVSAEDFAKEPHRNKLAVILSRTSHLSYHTGQLVLLK